MKAPSNRKLHAATMLFVCWLAFAAGLHAQKGAGMSPSRKKETEPKTVPSRPKPAAKSGKPASVVPPAPSGPVAGGSSIGLKVYGDWKVEADKDEDSPKTLGAFLPAGKPAMLFLISAVDPATLAAAKRIGKLEDDYSGKSLTMIAIDVVPSDTTRDIRAVAEQYDWDFPVVRDVGRNVVRGLRVRFTPEVILIDSTGRVRYAGPIDDSWMDARMAKQQYVRNALDALLAGKKIPNPEPTGGYYGKTIR
jgi:hypothetical protein